MVLELSREQALRGFTVDGKRMDTRSRLDRADTCVAAYAGLSNTTGSLTPGKRFDAVVWDDDLMKVPNEEMLEVRAIATIIDGKIVYGSLEL
jgi:predicted amidohydrolase YtcJ